MALAALSAVSRVALACACLALMRVRHEEAVLRATFPDYDAYAARVKRFVPGVL